MLTLSHIWMALTGQKQNIPDLIITEAVIDSRRVIPGSLFIALPGEKTDGHAYLGDAFKRGALLAIVQEDAADKFLTIDLEKNRNVESLTSLQPPFCIKVKDSLKALQTMAKYWRRQLNLRVIGITGSVGKSTTKELVAEVLSQKYHTFKNPGNYNNEIGLPLTILNLTDGYECVILEMGFYYPGEIAFLCDIAQPQVGIVTTIGTVHAERAGSQEEIVKGKTELIRALPSAPQGVAILNYDDPLVRGMTDKTKARVLTYGPDKNSDLWADEIITHGTHGIEFNIHFEQKQHRLRIPLFGRHAVLTTLRAVAAGLAEGLTMAEIEQGLKQSHIQLRMVFMKTGTGALILDDTYNATPESTMSAIDLLNEIEGNHIAVLGDMLELGAYEQEGHIQVGKHAALKVDQLITVGQRAKTIAETAQRSGLTSKQVEWVQNAQGALDLIKTKLKEGDVVLIKGSHGMRMDKITAAFEEAI